MGSLVTDDVSDDIAQELQMPIGPQAIKRCGETLAISSCNAQRSRHSSSNRAGSAESDTFPESALVQSVRRIPRTRLSTSRTVKKIDEVLPQLQSMLEARLDCTPIPDDLLKLTLGGRKNNHIHDGQGKEKRESARNPPEGQEVTRGTKDEIMDNCFRSHVYQCS